MGCNWVLAREVAKDPERECDWAAVGVTVGLVTAVFYFLAGYFLMPMLLPVDRSNLLPVARLCLLLIPLDISNQVLLAVEHGRMRWRRYNLLRLSFFIFYLTLIGLIGVTHRNQVRWFVSAFLASELLAVLLRLWIQRKSLAAGKLRFDQCRHLLRGRDAILRCDHQQSDFAATRHHPGREPAQHESRGNLCRRRGLCQRTVFPRRCLGDHFLRRSFE